jgi:protein N-terminal methyltransferase
MDGSAEEIFDEEDSSLTRFADEFYPFKALLTRTHFRSDVAWKNLFKLAGLHLVREQVQDGLPAGLYRS